MPSILARQQYYHRQFIAVVGQFHGLEVFVPGVFEVRDLAHETHIGLAVVERWNGWVEVAASSKGLSQAPLK